MSPNCDVTVIYLIHGNLQNSGLIVCKTYIFITIVPHSLQNEPLRTPSRLG